MSDRYGELVQSGLGKKIAKNLGLPTPVQLSRFQVGQPILTGEVALGASAGETAVLSATIKTLGALGARISADECAKAQLLGAGFEASALSEKLNDDASRFKVVIFDASNLKNSDDLQALYDFFHPIARKIKDSGRVIVIGRAACDIEDDIEYSVAQRALVGFVKSIAKEFKKGISANVIYVKAGLEAHLDGALKFFMSSKSAYVSGQVVTLDKPAELTEVDDDKPLAGKRILVTGASRGIGEAIAHVLARDGATVICLDVAAQLADLQTVAARVGGQALTLDITDAKAGERIIAAAGKLDGVVHNAGVTRDKTLAKMSPEQWQLVMNINLGAIARINAHLLANDGLAEDAHIVCVSSIAGIAGNVGQSNYATSKAGVIGLTTATAKALNNSARTINAVAPGFIETKMTAAIPFAIREAGRRMNAMSQGGEPVDVAETIAWLLSPASAAMSGNVIRVCGQSVLGA